MGAFKAVVEARKLLPGRVVDLAPEAWKEDWPGRPTTVVKVGLRRISDTAHQTARAEAAKYAVMMHDDVSGQYASYNDALMRWIIVYATCEPESVSSVFTSFQGSEDTVRDALTPAGIRYLWDQFERYHLETSPIVPEITDGDLKLLGERLASGRLLPPGMQAGAQARLRKLLGFCAQELQEIEGDFAAYAETPLDPLL